MQTPRNRDYDALTFVKSSFSFSNGNCVEVASLPGGGVAVRNSRDRGGYVAEFTAPAWRELLAAMKSGAEISAGNAAVS